MSTSDLGEAIRYRTSRDGPEARKISRVLSGLVDWVDVNYAKQTVFRRDECRAREVSARHFNDGGFIVREVDITVHGAHLACRMRGEHAGNVNSLSAFRVEDCMPTSGMPTLESFVMTIADDIVLAVSRTRIDHHDNQPAETGLVYGVELCWSKPFASVKALEQHSDTLCQVAIGELPVEEGINRLILQPANVSTDNNRLSLPPPIGR